MRPLALTAAIVLSFAGSAARAEPLTNPSGVTLGDPHDPRIGLVMRAPLWLTAEGYMVARDATFSTDVFNDVEPLRCWDLSVDPPGAVGAPLDRPAGPLGVNERAYRGHLAVAADGSFWTVATGSPFELHVYAAACDADPTLVRALTAADVDVALQGELWDDGRATWPARTSGIIYVPGRSGLLLRLDPGASPATPAVTALADSDAWYDALSPATAAADRRPDAWRIAGATMTPPSTPGAQDDRLWVAVEGPAPAGDERQTTLVTVGDDGAITVVRGPDRIAGASALVPWAAVDGAVLTGGRAVLGFEATTPTVLDLAARPGRLPVFGVYPFAGDLDPRETPWPMVADPVVANDPTNLVGDFIGSADGRLVMVGADAYTRELGLDPSVADFDRDRLSAAREAELGLSDRDADHDDDGVNDGAEVGYFATDPRSAASAPTRMTRALRMAPSSFREDMVGFQPSETDVPFAAPVLCHTFLSSEARQPTLMLGCLDRNGERVRTPPKIYGWWSFTPDRPEVEGPDGDPEAPHRYLYYDDFTGPFGQGDRVRLRYDPDTGATVELARVDCDNTDCKELPPLYAVDADTYLTVTSAAAGPGSIARHTSGAAPFAVVDPLRAACPVLASPDDACAGPRLGRVVSVQVAGWDPRHAAYLVMIQTATGGALYALGGQSATFVADAFALPLDGQRLVIQAHPGSHAGHGFFAAGTFQTPNQGSFIGAVALDDAFAPVPAAQPAIANPDGLGAAFKDGFLAVRFPQYWVDPKESLVGGDSRCAEADDVLLCDWPSSYRYDPKQVPLAELIEYVQVPDGLQPGEVVFAAPDTLVRATLGQQLTDARTPSVAEAWALWRVTDLGGVTPWLGESDFIDLVADDGVRAELATTRPLGPIVGMGAVGTANNTSARLCLAEPDAGRVWELTLADGLPVDAALRARGSAVGCGYAQDGTFGWVAADPPVLHVGAQSLALTGRAPSGLVGAVEGQWLVLDAVGDALCSNGAELHAVHRPSPIMAAAPGLQPEYFTTYLDRDGKVWSSTGLCAGADPDLALFDRELSLWQHAYGRLTVRPVEVPAASLAVRPDGIVVVASHGAAWNLYAEDDVFRLRPSYTDTGSHTATGTAVLDHAPWRRDVPRLALASSDPQGATAMVTVPGAPPVHPTGGWEHFADHVTEPVPDEEVGPEASDPDARAEGTDTAVGAETAPRREGGGCAGCSGGDTAPTDVAGLAVVIAGLLERRRRAAARLPAPGSRR